MFDVQFGNSTLTASPKMNDLVDHVTAYLELLNGNHIQGPEATINQDVEMLTISDTNATAAKLQDSAATSAAASSEPQPKDGGDDDERKRALRIAKTGNPINFCLLFFTFIPTFF